jgi:hypothetical protein
MNPEIFDLIEKGLKLLPILIDAGINVTTKIQQLIALNKAAADGTPVSPAELAKIRADFDADLDDFNKPIV